MAGRPAKYTDELASAICEAIGNGQSLRSICQSEGMPGKTTIHRWLNDNEEFRDQYARAKLEQADAIFDELLWIADNEEDINRAKLMIDTRKWIAGKLRPKKYGERVEHGWDQDKPALLEIKLAPLTIEDKPKTIEHEQS